jgi:hypothetical protein
MVVMVVFLAPHEFKARSAVAEIKPLHHVHFFEHIHRTVNSCQITAASPKQRMNFPNCQRVGRCLENREDRAPRPGDFPVRFAQALSPLT